MRSLDLFSGIGGFAKALHGIARPVAMCDLDPDAREVLRCRMVERRSELPLCPVFDDVRALKADMLPMKVDIVVGGWPCQDLSSVGLRKGLSGSRSGLVREVFRLIDETDAQCAFLENVPQLLSAGFRDVLDAFVFERGFEMSWCVLPASAVGAPHVRKRLFMWVRKPTFEYEWPEGTLFYEPHDWSPAAEPVRMVIDSTGNHRNKRQMLLGNSVVPDCLRSAFMVLASGFRKPPKPNASSLKTMLPSSTMLKPLNVDSLKERKKGERGRGFVIPKWGYARKGPDGNIALFAINEKHIPELKAPNLDLVLCPDAFAWDGPLQQPKYGMERSPLIKEPLAMTAWSTPRTVTCAANSLTLRVTRDLPTQVRYEAQTPDELRSGQVSTAFVEWIMGFPKDWTKLPALWKSTSPIGYRPGGMKAQLKTTKAQEVEGGGEGDGESDNSVTNYSKES